MAIYTLPDLPYDPAALEPHISAQIIELHHGKHHKAYVDGANKTLEQLEEARRTNAATTGALLRALAFNVSGHVLHSIYWANMKPKGGGEPTGELRAAIDRDFGSFEAFKGELNRAAGSTMGSGWGILAFEPLSKRLITSVVHDHQTDLVAGSTPLLVLDAWEHAFYLQYKTDKAKYFESIWNVWNWDDVAKRFADARAAAR